MGLTRLDSKMIETPAEIATLASTDITTTNLNVYSGVFTFLSAVNLAFNVSDYKVTEVDSGSYTFASTDNSKAFHFDTTTTSIISAVFPSSLSPGFNISIFNTGTGIIYLSAVNLIRATGQLNNTPYTGMFIYKGDDGFFYGVGVFE